MQLHYFSTYTYKLLQFGIEFQICLEISYCLKKLLSRIAQEALLSLGCVQYADEYSEETPLNFVTTGRFVETCMTSVDIISAITLRLILVSTALTVQMTRA